MKLRFLDTRTTGKVWSEQRLYVLVLWGHILCCIWGQHVGFIPHMLTMEDLYISGMDFNFFDSPRVRDIKVIKTFSNTSWNSIYYRYKIYNFVGKAPCLSADALAFLIHELRGKSEANSVCTFMGSYPVIYKGNILLYTSYVDGNHLYFSGLDFN